MGFASTEHLNLREQRPSDLDRILALVNDPAVQRSGPGYIVPLGGPGWRKTLDSIPDKLLMQVILEAKEPLEKGTLPPNASDVEREDALFVGMVTLRMVLAKSRDAEFSIGLVEKWRGRGYGTEAMQWLVKHSFEQLALHRLTLEVVESNAAAIALYKSV
jgi:RimJ/RimL family protein N-acetyltransferase